MRLRDRVLAGGTADEWVLLGSLLQQLDRGPMADGAYRAALDLRPGDLGAQVGLALVEGATGADGAERAAADLQRLATENPRSQLVAFNQGWLAAYRRQAEAARAAWRRTVALDPGTRLGRAPRPSWTLSETVSPAETHRGSCVRTSPAGHACLTLA